MPYLSLPYLVVVIVEFTVEFGEAASTTVATRCFPSLMCWLYFDFKSSCCDFNEFKSSTI
ncbi:hypothetical protein [Bacillus pacificus]